MINKVFILQCIEPYLNSNREISEFEFMELFASGDYPLSLQEQYEIIKIMIENDIEYVDEKDEETEVLDGVKMENINVINQNIRHLLKLKNEQLCVMAQNSDSAALAAICEKNKRFVYQMAIKIQGKYAGCCLAVDDLVQEGMIGMMDAVSRFDPEKEFSLLTYAWSWIRQSIERAVMNTGFLVRLPVHVIEKIVRISRYRKSNPDASVDEIVQIAGCEYSATEIKDLIRYSEQYLNVASLNTLVGDNEDSELVDFIPDENGMSLEDEVSLLFLRAHMEAVLKKLKPREAGVLMMRYGFDCNPHTLEEIGAVYKVTRERIRQIEVKALKTIRKYYAVSLRDYV